MSLTNTLPGSTTARVYYNNAIVEGDPFVSRSLEPVDYGDRWGMTETITLNGVVAKLEAPVGGATMDIGAQVAEMFKENFKELKVMEGNTVYYEFPSVSVDSIDFPKNKWSPKSQIRYTVKLKAHDVFHLDAVLDPVDSYNFTENEDGSVDVVHKISAKGIKTGHMSALDRAITFVDKHVGVNHYGTCDPSFMQNRIPVLIDQQENVNRLEGTYSVTEKYKYTAQHPDGLGGGGIGLPYLKKSKLTHNESISEEYRSVDYEAEYVTDDANGIASLRTVINAAINAKEYHNEVASLLGVAVNQVYQVSFSVNESEAANKISVKGTFQYGITDLTKGVFDYNISFTKDDITEVSTYSIDGKLTTYGTIVNKNEAIKNFKNEAYGASTIYDHIDDYLHDKVVNSEVYGVFGNARTVNPYPATIRWNEDPNKGTLSVNATYSDEDYLDTVADAKYNVSVTSSKDTFKEVASANVDGVYVLQNLNNLTQTNTKVNVDGIAPHGRLHNFSAYWDGTPFPNDIAGNPTTANQIAHEHLAGLRNDVADQAAPTNPLLYPGVFGGPARITHFLQDRSDDVTFPYNCNLSASYLHSPTVKHMEVLNLTRHTFAQLNMPYTRPPGYKWGF
jgi:hypothetical protein